ncbi:MAG: hypothetical protein K2K72_03235 [Duncaniella sp.]|nr:hypothetical protein [Duncaniella sp.]
MWNELPATRFDRLEDALAALGKYKREDPGDVIFLYPEKEEIDKEWERHNDFISSASFYTNLPLLEPWINRDVLKERALLSDEAKYIADYADFICRKYEVTDRNSGWELVWINDAISVELYVKPEEWARVKEMVVEFNRLWESRGFRTPLTLNDSLHLIEGQIIPKRGGFFTVKKENRQAQEAFNAFRDSLSPYLIQY